MHNEFRQLLHSAEGQSQHVVVVFLDVRGFSSFAGIAESTDTAEFLKSVYIRILDDYFPDAKFFKPTGDGLLILLGYDRDHLTEAVRSAVDRSVGLIEAFPSFCDDDEMVNFEVPQKLGIGLARGSATSMTAGGKVLDYSGRPLNLASRLMDLARPSGVVFDGRFGFGLLEKTVQERFEQDSAYVKGLAESVPMTVYCLNGYTRIPEYNKKPLDGFVRFTEPVERLNFKALEDRRIFRHYLTREPARTDNMEVHIEYPKVMPNGTKHKTNTRMVTLPAEYGTVVGRSFASVDYADTAAALKQAGIKGNWSLSTFLEYSVLDEDTQA